MKTTAGLWIDHRKAVIVVLSDKGEETRVIESNVEKQPGRFAGIRSTTPYEAQILKDVAKQAAVASFAKSINSAQPDTDKRRRRPCH